MREILDAIYGLLISPEAEDPLDRWDLPVLFKTQLMFTYLYIFYLF